VLRNRICAKDAREKKINLLCCAEEARCKGKLNEQRNSIFLHKQMQEKKINLLSNKQTA
jgi:hypothetical protein